MFSFTYLALFRQLHNQAILNIDWDNNYRNVFRSLNLPYFNSHTTGLFTKLKLLKVRDVFSLKRFIFMTVYSCHVTYAFQSESTIYSFLNVKELLAWRRCKIWSLSDCNWSQTHNRLTHKRTLNHLDKLASLAKWLSVRLWTKWLWVRVQLQSLNISVWFYERLISWWTWETLYF